MNLLVGVVVLVMATAASVTAMLLVRRRAPAGSYFADGDRAAGVFGVLATGFSVLLGFIIFLAFSAYDDSRAGAEDEATTVAQLVQTAQFLPPDVSAQLTGQLICYGRSVAGTEWDAMAAGSGQSSVNPWGVAMFRTIATVEPRTATEESAYDRWMEQTADRQEARNERLHPADGVIPVPLWIALGLICVVIVGFLLFFADSTERAATQAMLMGSVTFVLTLLMLLLVFFDSPHDKGIGGLQPVAMERSLGLVDDQLALLSVAVTPPCDGRGVSR